MNSKNSPTTNTINNNNNNNSIRKYLVLLHDCLAIKFVPLSPPSPKIQESTIGHSQNKSSTSTIQSPRRTTASSSASVRDDDKDDQDYDNKDDMGKSFINKRKQVGIVKSSYSTSTSTSSRQVDQSLKGLLLYKEFRDMNLFCFWNAALQESFEKLEYKGTVVPSTILVGSPIRKHLTILKTAFSRKMLKCPDGFRIEFVGEIEELIADPIEKSHFIPLSDSLCWSIHQLTSTGQEAFVEEILMELSSTFPETVLPPKELIYQVLERLTKDKKVYQTSAGYFVVTPDTHRYIVNTDPAMMFNYPHNNNNNTNLCNGYRPSSLSGFNQSFKGRAGTLDSLKSRPSAIPELPDDDLDGHDSIDYYEELPPANMKRCNSLRNSMKRSEKVSGCLPRRTFSMRSTKSRAKDKPANPSNPPNTVNFKTSRISLKDSVLSLDVYGVSSVNDQTVTRRRKHKSFLKKLLTFRRSRRGLNKDGNNENTNNVVTISKHEDDDDHDTDLITEKLVTFESALRPPKKMLTMSMSTQTSNSVENLPSSFGLLSIANPNNISPSAKSPELLDSDSGRYTESSASSASPQSEVDIEISNVTNMRSNDNHEQLGSPSNTDKDDTKHLQSRIGHNNPSPLSFESSCSPSPSFNSACGVDNSKWNPTTMSNLSPNLQSRCNSSASNSSSISSYRELYNKYRRKNPSYQQHSYNHHNHRQSHTLGSTTGGFVTLPPLPPNSSSKSQSPFKYPPRQFEKKQIYKEMSNRSSQKKASPDGLPTTTTTINTNLNNDNKKVQGRDNLTHSSSTSTTSTSTSMTTTTTVTQMLKDSSTNLELELLFPLGKLISAALTDFEQKSDQKEPMKKHNDPNGHDTGIVITNSNNNETKQVPENSKASSATTNTKTLSNAKMNLNSQQEKTEREGVISEVVTTTVNDLFTINCKSFIKTNQHNDGLTSTMEFKTVDSNPSTKVYKTFKTNINSININNNNKPKGNSYLIEPVSYKPFRFEKECRESEII